ncbi:MAG: glycosyltransferase family 2 protein [Phycisphaeraceae bacterium]|nr:glycosyltransferase family 2 protein [Phycisphaeraceae bacterium]
MSERVGATIEADAPAVPAAEPGAVPARSTRVWQGTAGQGPLSTEGWPHAPVSVVILTFNEEANIRDCILSCGWCDDVHVLDSGSTDRTREIAESLGAKVTVHPFRSFGDQRNWAIDHVPCKYPWHFHLDADERFTRELVEEMLRELGTDGSRSAKAAYLCPSKMMLFGRWLKYSGGYPSYQVRLFRFGQCRFVDFGHGQREDCHGEIGTLVQPYTHFNFSKGLLEWFYKHNDYSSREGREAMMIRGHGKPRMRQLFSGDSTARRRAWKNFSYFMKGRAAWRFLYNYILRGGILDGAAGFHYCAMISVYEYWTELKIKETAIPWTELNNRLVGKLLAERPERPGASRGSAA